MNNEPNIYLGKEAPQWMKDMFYELNVMFEESPHRSGARATGSR
jgi:hypothetical protein